MMYVGCKMPNGLRLDLVTVFGKPSEDGYSQERENFAVLKGVAFHFGTGQTDPGLECHGYAVTELSDDQAIKFAQWLKDNARSSILKDKLVIHAESRAKLMGQGRELESLARQFPALTTDDIKRFGGEPGTREAA